ncbi:MAG: hypothetical protein KAJ18_11840, partial [Candidatus Omnitrophica bacterium]|nr:hypothetical protein [Candidatus Omnitrophota bacterium]
MTTLGIITTDDISTITNAEYDDIDVIEREYYEMTGKVTFKQKRKKRCILKKCEIKKNIGE